MTTPDQPDWTKSVAPVERTAAVQANHTTPSASTLGPFDVAQASALAVGLIANSALTGAQGLLDIVWSDAASTWQVEEVLTFHTVVSYSNGTSGLQLLLPVKGPRVSLQPVMSNGSSVVLSAASTTRGDQLALRRTSNDYPSGLLLDTGLVAIAAGGNGATWYLPPVARAVNIRVGASAASVPASLQVSGVGRSAGAFASVPLFNIAQTLPLTVQSLEVPLIGLELFVTNNDTSSRSLRVTAWDAS